MIASGRHLTCQKCGQPFEEGCVRGRRICPKCTMKSTPTTAFDFTLSCARIDLKRTLTAAALEQALCQQEPDITFVVKFRPGTAIIACVGIGATYAEVVARARAALRMFGEIENIAVVAQTALDFQI